MNLEESINPEPVKSQSFYRPDQRMGLRLSGRHVNGAAKVGGTRRDALQIKIKFFAQANKLLSEVLRTYVRGSFFDS